MTQQLIDWTPPRAEDLVRHSDPPTSYLAAVRHLSSGKLTRHELLVYGAACREEGLTYREIHLALDGAIAEPVEVMRRLNDLAPRDRFTKSEIPGGLLKRGPRRKCRVSGTLATTWWKPGTTGEEIPS